MAQITVDVEDLVTLSDVAKRLRLGRSTVRMWYHRRHTSGFPRPVIDTAGGTRLWSWKEVVAWFS